MEKIEFKMIMSSLNDSDISSHISIYCIDKLPIPDGIKWVAIEKPLKGSTQAVIFGFSHKPVFNGYWKVAKKELKIPIARGCLLSGDHAESLIEIKNLT